MPPNMLLLLFEGVTSGSHNIDMEDVDVEFDPQAYIGPVKRWTGDSNQKARTVCAYEKEEDSPTTQFRTKMHSMVTLSRNQFLLTSQLIGTI
jgi:hypothetical protein